MRLSFLDAQHMKRHILPTFTPKVAQWLNVD